MSTLQSLFNVAHFATAAVVHYRIWCRQLKSLFYRRQLCNVDVGCGLRCVIFNQKRTKNFILALLIILVQPLTQEETIWGCKKWR